MVTRYIVREPRNCYGELICSRESNQPHYSVVDILTNVETLPPPSRLKRVTCVTVASNLTYQQAADKARELNAQHHTDMAYAINM